MNVLCGKPFKTLPFPCAVLSQCAFGSFVCAILVQGLSKKLAEVIMKDEIWLDWNYPSDHKNWYRE